MSLLTTCPRCASQFRIKPEQLAAGAGWAQCGVCGAMFDARATLVPEEAPEAPVPLEEAPPAAPLAPAPDLAAEPQPVPSPENVEAAMPVGIVSRQAGDAEELNSIIVVDPDAALPEEPESLPVILPPPGPASVSVAAAVAPSPPEEAAPAAQGATAPMPQAEAPSLEPRQAAPRRALWTLLALLLLIVLAGQGAYFQRDALVAAAPALRPALQQLCSWVGCRLALPHDLNSLAIIGSELHVSARNAHAATLRVTLANQSDEAQAWPNLRLSLQGLDGHTRASVVLAPEQYLGGTSLLAAGLPAQSQHSARVEVTVEGAPLLASQPYNLDIFY